MFNYFKLKKKIKKCKKEKKAFSLRVKSPLEFFKDLEKIGLEYVVLRWPEEVKNIHSSDLSRGKDYIDSVYGDVDILLNIKRLDTYFNVFYKHYYKNGIKIEFYSVAGVKGTVYKKLPYYPPSFAELLISNRCRKKYNFYALTGELYLISLVYHLVYHKGLLSGIPVGCSDVKNPCSSEKYINKLLFVAAESSINIPSEITLISLHNWLVKNNRSIPFDLLVRLEYKDEWLRFLQNYLTNQLLGRQEILSDSFIFILREDVRDKSLEKIVLESIGEKFHVVLDQVMSEQQVHDTLHYLRGGNWLEGNNLDPVLPYRWVYCVDESPEIIKDKMIKYPHVTNANFTYKHEIRSRLEEFSNLKIYGIHSNDNDAEAIYMYDVLSSCHDSMIRL